MKNRENTNKANKTTTNPSAGATKVIINGIEFIKPDTATATVYNGTVLDTVYSVKKTPAISHKRCKINDVNNIVIDSELCVTPFDCLVDFVRRYFDSATYTNKCVRFTLNHNGKTRFSCWRRVDSIRIYTDNPDIIPAIEWGADTHEQGLTHSAYTDFETIAMALIKA